MAVYDPIPTSSPQVQSFAAPNMGMNPAPVQQPYAAAQTADSRKLDMGALFGEFKSRVGQHIRPWREMVRSYSVPAKAQLSARVVENFSYYEGNYAVLAGVIALISVLLNPLTAIGFILLVGVWVATYRTWNAPIVMFGKVIEPGQKLGMVVTLSLIVLLFTGAIPFFFKVLGATTFFTLGHAMFGTPRSQQSASIGNDDQSPSSLPQGTSPQNLQAPVYSYMSPAYSAPYTAQPNPHFSAQVHPASSNV